MGKLKIIQWENWNEDELRSLIKELYEKKGYAVKYVHGRLEPGIDLVARRFDSAKKRVIETLGIQASMTKADKTRVGNAAMALTQKELDLSYFLIIAIQGYTEDFDLHRRRSELKDRILFMDGDSLEKDLLANGILPERELERLENEFYKSETFTILEDVTTAIFEKGYSTALEFDSALKEMRENKKMIMENLRLLMRGLQETSASSGRVYLSMSNAISYNRLDLFVDEFIKGQSLVLKPLKKIRSANALLEPIPAAMKLFFGSLSGTERGLLILGGKNKTSEFWIFTYFDPEAIYKHGYRIVLLQIFYGLQERMNEIKTRVETMIQLLEDENEMAKRLKIFVSSFPMKKDEVDSEGFLKF